MSKPVRMKDIAQKIGVSVSTVSRVLNGVKTDYISKETEEKINFAAYTMGYKKNVFAQALTGGKTYLIDAQIPCHYPFLIRNLVDKSLDGKYQIISRDIEADYLANKDIINLSVDGVVSIVDGFLLESYMKNLSHKNCVSLGHHCSKKFDHIYDDFYEGTCEAIEYLIEKGARKIAYLTDDLMDFDREEKIRAYRDVLKRYGLEAIFINTNGISPKEIYNKILSDLQNGLKIDAVFCHSDHRCNATIQAIKDVGYKIPKDISVISSGYLNDRSFDFYSRIVIDDIKIIDTAWDFLMNRIENPNIPIQKCIMKYKFQKGNSTK